MSTNLLKCSVVNRVVFEFNVPNFKQLKTDYLTARAANNDNIQYISSEKFELGSDMMAYVRFYPIGDKNSRPESTALFVYIVNREISEDEQNILNISENEAEKRMFNVFASTGEKKLTFPMTEAQRKKYKQGYGYINFVSQEFFQKNPKIKVRIEMEEPERVNGRAIELAFEEQLIAVYDNCMSDGDITIIVEGTENKNDCCLDSPPLKKRKVRKSKRTQSKNKNKNENESKNEEIDNISSLRMSGLMLKSASPMFAAMLDHSMVEQQTKTIVIYSDFEEDVYDMFYFICTNKLKISANAARILALAHYYQLLSLGNACSERLLDELSVETFVDVVKIFNKYEIVGGYQRLPEFAKINAIDIKCRPEFNDLPHYFRMCCNSGSSL